MQPRKRKDGYTKEQLEYLKEIAEMSGRTNKEITEMFNSKFNQNRTIGAIIGIKSRLNIKSYTRVYTDEQISYLREITPGRTHRAVTKMFNKKYKDNRTESSIKSIVQENGIKTGSTGRFEKGNLPGNTLPIGTEIMREDGYVYVKTENPNTWKQKHHIIWEELNGAVPENHVILFGDKDRENFDINNLILASKAQVLQLNRYDLIKEDADLTRTGIIIADIYSKIGQRKK